MMRTVYALLAFICVAGASTAPTQKTLTRDEKSKAELHGTISADINSGGDAIAIALPPPPKSMARREFVEISSKGHVIIGETPSRQTWMPLREIADINSGGDAIAETGFG